MTSRAEQLEAMAEECRTLANATTGEYREQLLEIAKRFERLARHRRLSEITTLAILNWDT